MLPPMDLRTTAEQEELRRSFRDWLTAHLPWPYGTGLPPRFDDLAETVEFGRRWQAQLAVDRWVGITWPEEYGGRGLGALENYVVIEELARARAPELVGRIGINLVGPTLLAHGTPDQKARFLPHILSAGELWCQLFSEPAAGSDLPSLITRAERDGDEYVVNGQKVWTSFAQFADWGILLARTGGAGSGREGISYFLVDMATPGIDVRPLRQATGVAHFNEVFLSDVRVPAAHMVGPEGEGWKVARTTLASERMSIGSARGTTFGDVRSLVKGLGRDLDALERQRVAQAYISFELLRYLGLRVQTSVSQGKTPGAEGSILKLAISQQGALLGDLGMALLGPAGVASDGMSPDAGFWREKFVGQWSSRIGGGTDQMQRNQVGERVLGLPREPKPI